MNNMNTITKSISMGFREEIFRVAVEEYHMFDTKVDPDIEELEDLYKEYTTDIITMLTEDTAQTIMDLIPLEEVQWLLLAEELMKDIKNSTDYERVKEDKKESEDLL